MNTIKENGSETRASLELSTVYFTTGLTILIIATLLGFLNRLTQTGTITYSANIWYTLMTLHGMAAFVGWGAFVCVGMSYYVLAKTTGGLHSVEWAKWAYYLFVAGFVLIIISALYGSFGASWVFLFPLPFYGYWEPWATTIWTLGVVFAGLGILLAETEVIMTIKSSGYSFIAALGFESFKEEPKSGYKVPLQLVPLAVNAIGLIIATIPFAVLLILFLIKNLFAADMAIDALVAKNVLWWFGHPIVYALLFPAGAMAYYMLSRVTNGQKLVGDRISRLTWAIAFVIQNIVGSHHIYQDLVQPLPIQITEQLLTYVITLPSVSSIFVVVATLWVRDFEWTVPVKYMYLATLGWLLAGMSGLVNATILLNNYVHNTLWVVGHFHTMALLNITMMIFGTAYFMITDWSGKEIWDTRLATWGMWLKYIGTIGLVHCWFLQGIMGGLRRTFVSSPGLGFLTWLSIPFGLSILIGIWLSTYVLWRTSKGDVVVSPETSAIAAD